MTHVNGFSLRPVSRDGIVRSVSEKIRSRITQSDVARAAGVARTTVSYALKDNPKIPRATREHVQKVARQLGYMPDPMLSSLALYRSRQRPKTFHGTLAWLFYTHDGDADWRGSPHYRGYFSGAMDRALFHGYQLEEFILHTGTMSSSRAAEILRTRNVSGILLSPLPEPGMVIDFGWKYFSVVAFGYTLLSPRLHTVTAAHYQNVRYAMQKLKARGYRRIGMIIDRVRDLRCHSSVSAGYLVEQMTTGSEVIPVHFDYSYCTAFSPESIRQISDYVRRHRIEAILTSESRIDELISSLPHKVPDDIAVAGICLSTKRKAIGGILEDSEGIGAVAIDLLVAMIQRGERGIPETPIRSHVEGVWHEGLSVQMAG